MQIIDLEHVPASVGYDHNDAVVDDQYLHGVSTFVRGGLSREHLSGFHNIAGKAVSLRNETKLSALVFLI